MKLIIGSHVSFKKDTGLVGAVQEILSYGGNAFMFYTGAPQNTIRSEISKTNTLEAHNLMKENNIDINNVVVHAPYIINLANKKVKRNYNFSISFLTSEIKRCVELGVKKIILHPGSSVGISKEEGINNIIEALNIILANDHDVMILLETMAGKGNEIGGNFTDIKTIIDGICNKDKIGVCLDTCHINDSGYDVTKIDEVIEEFDKIVGLNYLQCLHINDSNNEIGVKKDRHANIGYGTIGFENLLKIIYHKAFANIPKILETPYVTINNEEKKRIFPPYKTEIEMIKSKQFNSNLIDDIRSYYK
ncbi:MAG: deoxyribonuclease IV [bacterium]|nr:deoxyribonuclease IV [bacterium]